jgi:hypothetical protein
VNDPADQKASDEAIKRNTNLTPTGVRQALDQTASDFQRRVDAQSAAQPTVSTPKEPPQITVSETRLDGQPVVLPMQSYDDQNPFQRNSLPNTGTLTDIIIVFNGTAEYCDLSGNVTGPV